LAFGRQGGVGLILFVLVLRELAQKVDFLSSLALRLLGHIRGFAVILLILRLSL
jgi:hypothetical protein